MCSITIKDLVEIGDDAEQKYGLKAYETMTMHDIVKLIIKPECKKTGKPYSVSLNPKGLEMNVFCTHNWSENFKEFVECIEQAYASCLKKPNIWICSFALFQGDAKDIEKQLDKPLENAPFVQALSKAKEFLVIRNKSSDLYSRIWCVCELVFAKQFKLVPAKTKIVGPEWSSSKTLSVEYAEAHSETDRKKSWTTFCITIGATLSLTAMLINFAPTCDRR